jgi:putative spermidine/putrescine transport system permease protein
MKEQSRGHGQGHGRAQSRGHGQGHGRSSPLRDLRGRPRRSSFENLVRRRHRRAALGWTLFGGFLLVLFVVPVLVLLLTAVTARWRYPGLVPSELTFRGIDFVRRNGPAILSALASSTGYSLLTVVAAVLLSLRPAEVLARFEFPGRIFLEALLLSPVLIPSIAWATGLHFLLIRLGLANTRAGVVLVLTAASYPYVLRSLIAGYQQIDPDFDTCAENLGAGAIRRLVTVHLPLLGPAILAGGSVVFLVAFSEYFLVFLTGGGVVSSYTGYLFPYLSSGDNTISSALTLLFVVVPIGLFLALEVTIQRFYRRRGMV